MVDDDLDNNLEFTHANSEDAAKDEFLLRRRRKHSLSLHPTFVLRCIMALALFGCILLIAGMYYFKSRSLISDLLQTFFNYVVDTATFSASQLLRIMSVMGGLVSHAVIRGDIYLREDGSTNVYSMMNVVTTASTAHELVFVSAEHASMVSLRRQPDGDIRAMRLDSSTDHCPRFFNVSADRQWRPIGDGQATDAWGQGRTLWEQLPSGPPPGGEAAGVAAADSAEDAADDEGFGTAMADLPFCGDPRESEWYEVATTAPLSRSGAYWWPTAVTNQQGALHAMRTVWRPVYTRWESEEDGDSHDFEPELLGLVGVTSAVPIAVQLLMSQLVARVFHAFGDVGLVAITTIKGVMVGSSLDLDTAETEGSSLAATGATGRFLQDSVLPNGDLVDRAYTTDDPIVLIKTCREACQDIELGCGVGAPRRNWYSFINLLLAITFGVLLVVLPLSALLRRLIMKYSRRGEDNAERKESVLIGCAMVLFIAEFLLWNTESRAHVEQLIQQSVTALNLEVALELANAAELPRVSADTLALMVDRGIVGLENYTHTGSLDGATTREVLEASFPLDEQFLDHQKHFLVGSFLFSDPVDGVNEIYGVMATNDEAEASSEDVGPVAGFGNLLLSVLHRGYQQKDVTAYEINHGGVHKDPEVVLGVTPEALVAPIVAEFFEVAATTRPLQPRWTSVMLFGGVPSMGLVVPFPAVASDGICRVPGNCLGGIAMAQIGLENLASFLRDIETGGVNTMMFIVERGVLINVDGVDYDGAMIASRDATVLTDKRVLARDSTDFLTREADRIVHYTYGSYAGIEEDSIAQRGEYILSLKRIGQTDDLDWVLVVIIPSTEFYADLDRMEQVNIYIMPPLFLGLLLYPASRPYLIRWLTGAAHELDMEVLYLVMRRLYFFCRNRGIVLEAFFRSEDKRRSKRLSTKQFRRAIYQTGFKTTEAELDLIVKAFGVRSIRGGTTTVPYMRVLAAIDKEVFLYIRNRELVKRAGVGMRRQGYTKQASNNSSSYDVEAVDAEGKFGTRNGGVMRSLWLLWLRMSFEMTWGGWWRRGATYRGSVDTRSAIRSHLYLKFAKSSQLPGHHEEEEELGVRYDDV